MLIGERTRMPLSYYPMTLEQATKQRADYSGIAVLLVDDEPTALELCAKLLERMGFSEIDTAGNGQAGWAMMQERKYGFVISDWNMPEMTGLDLVRKIRADEKLARTPFLMTSVDGAVERARVARQAGVNAFLIKPFDGSTLRAKLHQVLRPNTVRAAAA